MGPRRRRRGLAGLETWPNDDLSQRVGVDERRLRRRPLLPRLRPRPRPRVAALCFSPSWHLSARSSILPPHRLLFRYTPSLRLIVLADEKYFMGPVIACRDGSATFPKDRLNDGFCDCPDGTDEPGSLLPHSFILWLLLHSCPFSPIPFLNNYATMSLAFLMIILPIYFEW